MPNLSRDGACCIEGCDRPIQSKRMCGLHYQRWYNHGDPLCEKRLKLAVVHVEFKTCEQCGGHIMRPANRSVAQWERMRFCSPPCANRWRALTHNAMQPGVPGHGEAVRAGWARSTRGKRAGRKRHRKQQRKAAQQAERNRRYQLELWHRLCLGCDTPIASGQRCFGCNRQRKRDQRRRWNEEHPQYQRLYKRAYARLKADITGTCTHQQAKARFDYYGGCCAYCHMELGDFDEIPRTWHWDHVIALSRGGTAWPANLRPACSECNRSKSARSLDDWRGQGTLGSKVA